METHELLAIDSRQSGPMGLLHLRRMWARVQLELQGHVDREARAREWTLDNVVVDGLGVGLEDSVVFLFQPGLSYEALERWIVERTGGAPSAERVERINAQIRLQLDGESTPEPLDTLAECKEPVLSDEDLAHFAEHGYVVIHDAVPPEHCAAAARVVWESIGADPEDPESWYTPHELRQKIMIQLFQHPALEANRRSYRIHRAFAQLWGSEQLRYSTDRISFNPPVRDDYPFQGPFIHWDVEFEQVPLPFGLQGLLYLTDTAADQGAFACVPGFHHHFDEWLAAQPPGDEFQNQDFEAMGLKPIAGRAGDFILWHHALPHGPTPNTHHLPRLVQYIKLYPVGG